MPCMGDQLKSLDWNGAGVTKKKGWRLTTLLIDEISVDTFDTVDTVYLNFQDQFLKQISLYTTKKE